MEIETRTEGDGVVLTVSGCLDTASTKAFTETVEAAATRARRLVFDFTGLEFIASAALRELVSVYKRLKPQGGDVVLTGMNEVVRGVFDVTGLATVFTIR